jgi:hypothetical protein
MKKLDKNELFDIFSQYDQDVLAENAMHEDVDNDFITFGTIITAIQNYDLLDQIYSHRFEKHYDSVKDNIKMKYFNGVMRYFDRINVLQPDTVNDLNDEFGKQSIIKTLQHMVDFYEKAEHYEKCAIIFKFLQKFL